MPKLSKKHPPLRGPKMAICLALSKSPAGVSQLDATLGGGGTRLAPQIGKLEKRGHHFRREWEKASGSRFMRYWWLGYKDMAGVGDVD